MKKAFLVGCLLAIFWVALSYNYYAKISIGESILIESNSDQAIMNYSASEKAFDLKDGVAKGIYWSRRKPSEKPFLYSICYLHGFSSSRKESLRKLSITLVETRFFLFKRFAV